MQKRSLVLPIAFVFFFTSFLTITIIKNIGLIILFSLCFLVMLVFRNKICFLKEDKRIVFMFYVFPFVSFALSIFSIFICGIPFIEFYPYRAGRIVNNITYLIFFLYFIDKKNKGKISTEYVIDIYLKSCYVLIFFGIWQLLNSIFDIPYPNFETRDHIHSIDKTMLPTFLKIRVTSIAAEPSFLVPYLMDAVIILFYSRKWILLALCVVLSFFTLSPSMYVNLFIVAITIFFFTKAGVRKTVVGIILATCFILIFLVMQPVFILVLNRISPQNLLQEYRVQAAIQPINFMFTEASAFNFIFGFGPKGIEYIGKQSIREIITDAHVVLIDWFVEYGIIGAVLFIFLFLYLYQIAKKTYMITKNRLAQLMCINLFITGLFRSDYASPRYTIIFLFILFMYKDSKYNLCG